MVFNLLTDQDRLRNGVTLHNRVLGNTSNIHFIPNMYDKIVIITLFLPTGK